MLICPLQPPKALVFAFKTYFLYPTFQCTLPPDPLLSCLALVGVGAEAGTRSLILTDATLISFVTSGDLLSLSESQPVCPPPSPACWQLRRVSERKVLGSAQPHSNCSINRGDTPASAPPSSPHPHPSTFRVLPAPGHRCPLLSLPPPPPH